MKNYTLTEDQIKELVEQSFELGVLYLNSSDIVMSKVNNLELEDAMDELDHSGDAKNDIITRVLVNTPQGLLKVRNSKTFDLFEF